MKTSIFVALKLLVACWSHTQKNKRIPVWIKNLRTRLIPHVLRCNNYASVNVEARLQTKRGHDTHPSSHLIILQSVCGERPSHSLKADQNCLFLPSDAFGGAREKWKALFSVSDRRRFGAWSKTIKSPAGCPAQINIISWHQLQWKQLR